MKHKEQYINEIINKNNYKNYLELGFGNGTNFNKIKVDSKVSVDVNGEADFNEGDLEFFNQNEKEFDCVFIDSDHIAEHVRKVIIESLKVLSKDGCIILHDTLPKNKEMQIVPRKQTSWTGDVWRAAVGLKESYPDMRIETYRADYGLTVVYPEGKKVRKHFENMEMTYEEFNENKVELLNIID